MERQNIIMYSHALCVGRQRNVACVMGGGLVLLYIVNRRKFRFFPVV